MKKEPKNVVVTEPKAVNLASDVPDPLKFPWAFKDESVSEITCIGVLEFVPGEKRPAFMDEAYRVLTPGGKMLVKVPYLNSGAAVQDYALQWPPFVEASFCYFDKTQRDAINLKRNLVCDFEVGFGYDVMPEVASRNDETRSFQIKHYNNVVTALTVVLTKRKK